MLIWILALGLGIGVFVWMFFGVLDSLFPPSSSPWSGKK